MNVPPVIEIVPYNEEWPRFYEEEAEKVKGALGKNCVTVHHIGSTAVPGLAAKPIIDILIVVKNILDVDEAAAGLEELGFTAKGEYGIPFRRYFRTQNANVHIFEEGSPEIERHLHFRDYLKKNPEACKEYELLKKTLATKHPTDREAYTNGKDEFIRAIDQKAATSHLRLVIACTSREWEMVRALRALQKGKSDEIDEEHTHLLLLRGVDIIGYAELVVQQAALCMCVLQPGLEEYKEPFEALLDRWLSHQKDTPI